MTCGKKYNKIRYPFPVLRCMGSAITHLAGSLSVLLVSSASHLNNTSLGVLVRIITSYHHSWVLTFFVLHVLYSQYLNLCLSNLKIYKNVANLSQDNHTPCNYPVKLNMG